MRQARRSGAARGERGEFATMTRRRAQNSQKSVSRSGVAAPAATKPMAPKPQGVVSAPKNAVKSPAKGAAQPSVKPSVKVVSAGAESARREAPWARAWARREWRAPRLDEIGARIRSWNTPWSRLALHAAGMWLATRLAYVALTFFAVALSSPGKTSFTTGILLQHWERLDTNWYVNISRYGYWAPTAATFARDGSQMPTAFFPVYPALIKVMSQLLGDTQRTFSALLVANLGTLLAFVGMAFFAANEDGIAAGTRTLRLAIAYPLAFFLAAGYTDGLFFGLAVFALFFARRGWWYAAALCAFIAGLTRITALALILPLAWEYARQQGWFRGLAMLAGRAIALVRRTGWRVVVSGASTEAVALHWRILGVARMLAVGALVAVAAPLGLGLYMRYLGLTFHDPLSFAHAAQTGWYHVTLGPWTSIPLGLHLFFALPPWSYAQAQIMLDLGAVFVFTLLTLVAAPRMPFAFTLYMVGLLALAVASPTIFAGEANIFSSAGRYLIPSAPIFLMLSRWTAKRPALESFFVDGGFLLQATLATLWLAVAAYIV